MPVGFKCQIDVHCILLAKFFAEKLRKAEVAKIQTNSFACS